MSDASSKRKLALITGASSGIGREFAIQLAQLDYAVVAVARREAQLKSLLTELSGEGHRYVLADLATEAGVRSVTDALSACHFDLLINNAGYSVLAPFYQTDLAKQKNLLAVNCAALTELAHAFLRQSQAGDALVNLGSVVSYLSTPAQPVYSASKAFIAALSECLWVEHKDRGVYVMGLCPGLTQTEFIAGATGGEADGQAIPELMVQSAEQVVAEALRALRQRKKAIIVTGWVNKLMLQLSRFLSRHRLIKVLAVIGDPERAL